MRLCLFAALLLTPASALAASGTIAELSVCYPAVVRPADPYLLRPPVFAIYGHRDDRTVVSARATPTFGPVQHFDASGFVYQALDASTRVDGGQAFELTRTGGATWVSWKATLRIAGATQDLECFDEDTSPNQSPAASRYVVVGTASTVVSLWAATPDLPDLLKPVADANAAAQCAGATRIGDYLSTYESVGTLSAVVVTAHYRCGAH